MKPTASARDRRAVIGHAVAYPAVPRPPQSRERLRRSRAVWHDAQFGIRRCSAFAPFGICAVRHSALFGIRAVRHSAPFGIPRSFGIRAVRHFAPLGSA